MNMSRREFLKTVGKVTVGYAALGGGLIEYGRHVEAVNVVIDRVEIPIKNLKPALEGFRIAQLTDIHLYPHTTIDLVHEAVAIANQLKPDLTVLTGDYVTDEAESITELAPVLAGLNARHGIFTSLGNHDLWTDPYLVRTTLEKEGLPVLVNQGLNLNVGGENLYLAGLDDCWSGQPDLTFALANHKEGTPVVLLAHEPDFADIHSLDERVSLQLSGHTHGGQVRIPGIGAIITPTYGKKYDQGLFNVNGMWVYTNRGLGSSPVPFRVNCPPEVTELTLVRA